MRNHPVRTRLAAVLGVAALATTTLTPTLAPAASGSTAAAGGAAAAHRSSGSGGLIAFSGFPDDPENGDRQVFVINADGTGERQLTSVPDGSGAGSPAISPDGRTIAYLSDVSGSLAVWAMGTDGSDQHELYGVDGFDFQRPSWSPDGRRLVATRCDDHFGFTTECDLVVLRADGSRIRTLLSNERRNSDPAWSPDGSTIAFTSDRLGFVSTINVIPAAGGTPRRITAGALEAFWPDWSPDGKQLLISDNCCQPGSQVWRVRPDGSGLTRLTSLGGRGGSGFASWSPDGRRVVFVSDFARPPDTGGDLYTMRADGSDIRLLVGDHPDVALSDWGPAPASGSGR